MTSLTSVLFVVWFDNPSQQFSVMSGRVFLGLTSTKQRIKCLAQGYNAVAPVRLKPTTPLSRVKHSTTEPPRSIWFIIDMASSEASWSGSTLFSKEGWELWKSHAHNVLKWLSTVNLEIFVNSIKRHICDFKNLRLGYMIHYISKQLEWFYHLSIFLGFYFHETLHMRGFYFHETSHMHMLSFMKIKPSRKFPNLQYIIFLSFSENCTGQMQETTLSSPAV